MLVGGATPSAEKDSEGNQILCLHKLVQQAAISSALSDSPVAGFTRVGTELLFPTTLLKELHGTYISSWNVAGIGSNMADPEWGVLIDHYDLCLFQETLALVAPHRMGFATYQIPALQGARGRPYGGLCIWVATHLGCTVKLLDSYSHDILGILLTFLDGTKIVVVNAYLRPTPSLKVSPTLNALDEFLLALPTLSHKILGGDFNCHYEPLDGMAQEEDSVWTIPGCSMYPTKGWTASVIQLTKLTIFHSLRACNGRFPGDTPGKTTYNRSGKGTTIDYIMVNVEFWFHVKDFGIKPRIDSDHNLLSMELKYTLGHTHCLRDVEDFPSSNLILDGGGRRIRWSRFIQSPDMKADLYHHVAHTLQTLCNFPLENHEPSQHLALQEIHIDLITKLASYFFVNTNYKPRSNTLNHWFSKTCRMAKSVLVREIKSGPTAAIRAARSHYKKTLNEAKRDWEAERWASIKGALDTRD